MGSAEREGEIWSVGAETWAELQEPNFAPAYDAALDATGAAAGTVLLDAGCGAGLALVRATERGARVSGFDASEGLLEVARERLPEADLRQGDLEDLPYDDHTFDVVTAFNSVQFAEDPLAALREIARVSRSGGAAAIVTWAPLEESEMSAIFGALAALVEPPAPGQPGPFALAERGRMEELIARAGMTVREARELPLAFDYDDLDAAIRGMIATGPGTRTAAAAGAERARAALEEAFSEFVQPDRGVRLENRFRLLLASA